MNGTVIKQLQEDISSIKRRLRKALKCGGCPLTFEEYINTTYTVTEADSYNKLIILNNANPITLTIPNDETEDIPIGTSMSYEQGGAGTITVSGAAGVTVNGIGLSTIAQYGVIELIKKSANNWLVVGGA